MAEKVYIPCPMCPRNWVPEDGDSPVCHECETELKLITAINDLVNSVNALKAMNGSTFKPGHVMVMRGAQTKLESLLDVLERYPRKD